MSIARDLFSAGGAIHAGIQGGPRATPKIGAMVWEAISALSLVLAQAAPSPAASDGICAHEAEIASPAMPDTTDVNSESDLFAIVTVLVAPNGSVESAKIYRSSGNLYFDQASVRAARHSTYKPKVVDCIPVEGTVYFYTSRTGGYPPRPGQNPTAPPWPKDLSPPPPRII